MKNFHKTINWTILFSLIAIIVTFSVQWYGKSVVNAGCSYLDPIYIDILAFAIGLFLIFDGFHRIWEHKNDRFKKQFTRAIRVSIGFGLLTLHIMQFVYK